MQQVFNRIDTRGTAIIGLYFSGEYCRFCKEFTPVLVDAYEEMRSNNIDIVYVSSDKSLEQYTRYRATQPWQALDYEDVELRMSLRDKFDIRTIPALLFFDTTHGVLLQSDGRDQIESDRSRAIQALKDSVLTGYDSDDNDF
jgi:thioredoxin-related protein